MRFVSIVLTALASVGVLASPLPPSIRGNDVSAIGGHIAGIAAPDALAGRETPPVPSVSEIKTHMHSEDEMAGKSLFYSGPGGYAKKANDLAKKTGRKLLKDFWIDPKYQDTWQNDMDASAQFFDNASAAMAELSSGEVWVLLPSDTTGTDWKQDTVWARMEWPNLSGRKNPLVTKVIRVNPDNSNQETIYTK